MNEAAVATVSETSAPVREHPTAQQGWVYVAKLSAAAVGILLCLAAVKFFTEHRLAPKNFGLGGVLSQQRPDLLLIGSSHTRKSYDMRELEQRLGTSSAFLVGYDGTDLVTISLILDYLAAQPERCPRHVVVEAYSAMLARKADVQDPRFFEDAPPPLKMKIIRSYLASHPGASAVLDVFDLVVNRGNEQIVTHPIYSILLRENSYKGGGAGVAFPGVSASEFRRFGARIASNKPDPKQVAALANILRLSKEKNISIVFIETPLPEPVSSNPEVRLLKGEFRKLVAGHETPYIDGDIDFPTSDPAMFADDNHLSTAGKMVFTTKISPELRAWISNSSFETRDSRASIVTSEAGH